jgi:YHS domain-containing protein
MKKILLILLLLGFTACESSEFQPNIGTYIREGDDNSLRISKEGGHYFFSNPEKESGLFRLIKIEKNQYYFNYHGKTEVIFIEDGFVLKGNIYRIEP